MANRRISHAKGKGSMNHNNRVHIYKNVDASKIQNNIFYARENLEDAYQKCFGQALEDYNAKQKRADRKIDDYYRHLFGNARKDTVATSSNKEKSFYEIVAGIGDRNTCAVGSADGELAAKILDEYARGFSKRNPNFYVFNSVMHLDEKTPHLHIDYVPVAVGYKNGLETRNSQSVALQQMGFGKEKDSINKWRIQERQILRELCEKYGLEIAEETQGRGKTFTPDEYKKLRDEAKEEIRTDPEILDEIKEEISADFEEELLAEQQHLVDEIEKHRQAVSSLQGERAALQTELDKVEGKRVTLESVKAYTAIPSKLNKDNVVIPLTQYNNLVKTAIEGAQSARQKKELSERKSRLDTIEKDLAEKEKKLLGRVADLDKTIARAASETDKYKRLYNQEKIAAADLLSQVSRQRDEAKRWEDNYNSLYSQHVKLKRSKGLEMS